MRTMQINHFLAGLAFALMLGGQGHAQTSAGRQSEACESTANTKGSGLIDLETLVRTEQHALSLRGRLIELQLQELELLSRLDDLELRLRPDNIQRQVALVGSARPMDEWREAVRISLEKEKAKVNKQLELLKTNREWLEGVIRDADADADCVRRRTRTED